MGSCTTISSNIALKPSNKTKQDIDPILYLRWFSIQWICVGLLIGTGITQSGLPYGIGYVGQVFFWFNILAAVIIIFSAFKKKFLIEVIVGGLIFSKMGRIVFGDGSNFYFCYTFFYVTLFCGAGAVVALRNPTIVYKQVMVYCFLSLPVMILQILGIGAWVQFLRLDVHNEYETLQIPTLFVSAGDLIITTFQARPAGFCYANNILAVIIVFAIGLHFARFKKRTLSWNDFILCAIAVLSMAKITFLSFGVLCAWMLLFGDSHQKIRSIKIILLFSVFLALYAFFFPGLFEYTTSLHNLYLNFMMRWHDLLASFKNDTLPQIALKNVEGDLALYKVGGRQSGYSKMGKYLIYFAMGILILWRISAKRLKKMRRNLPKLPYLSMPMLFIIGLIPLASSVHEGALFWFIVGTGLSPLIILLKPYYLQVLMKYRESGRITG